MKKFIKYIGSALLAAMFFASCSNSLMDSIKGDSRSVDSTTTTDTEDVTIYVQSSSAPTIWVWENDGKAVSELMGYTWSTQPTMSEATDMVDNDGWYSFDISSSYLTEGNTKTLCFILNKGSTVSTSMTSTFWYDGDSFYTEDPTTLIDGGDIDDFIMCGGDVIWVEADSAPTIWVWEEDGYAVSELMGYSWSSQPTMEEADYLNDNTGWYMFTISSTYNSGEPINFILNKDGTTIKTGLSGAIYYDKDGNIYSEDPTVSSDTSDSDDDDDADISDDDEDSSDDEDSENSSDDSSSDDDSDDSDSDDDDTDSSTVTGGISFQF